MSEEMLSHLLFAEPVFWHWWLLAVTLVALEVLAPGVFFLWLGVSAVVVGGVVWTFPEVSWELQLALFAVLGVVSAFAGRRLSRISEGESDHPGLSRRGEQMKGQVFVLVRPIENGRGRIRAGDGEWIVSGEDMPEGARVRVVDVDGAVLSVEKAGN